MGQWRGSAGKGQEGPHWEGTAFGGEASVPWVCVPTSPAKLGPRLTPHPVAEHAWGSPRAFLKVLAA